MSILIENVTVKQLRELMSTKIEVDEAEYQEWRATEKEKQILRTAPQRKRRKDHVRGSDFKQYWVCPRRLYWNTHEPIVQKGIINKSYFRAIKKHDFIEEELVELGWSCEHAPKRRLHDYSVNGVGHMDAISPTERFFLEIKHNPPTLADELQSGWYQYLHIRFPMIVLLYRERVVIIPDHSRLMNKYIPRVVGTVIHDFLPPLHPSFPKCRGYCDYAPRCGRTKRFKMRDPIPQEWIDWLEKIGASRKRDD